MPNGIGISSLKKYKAIARFEFHPKTNKKRSKIIWCCNNGTKVKIVSPLRMYLGEQRQKMRIHEDWSDELNKMIAKDYSILARFSDEESSVFTAEGTLREYFIAGIRGLGTWGTTWYIDRKYKELKDIKEDEHVQLLLETTFKDGKIMDVKNVSDMEPDYFREQQLITNVRKVISEHLENK